MAANSPKQSEIEEEFGEPFKDVVLGFANDGYSVNATANILGCNPSSFRRLIERKGWKDNFPYGQTSVMANAARREKRMTPGAIEALRRARESNPNYFRIEFMGVLDTLAGHARRHGIPVPTARHRNRRRPEDWDYVFSKKSHIYRPDIPEHPWNDSINVGQGLINE